MPAEDLVTRVAVLEVEVAAMKGGQKDILETQKQMAADLHAIRETIATTKGAWWAVSGIALLLLTGGGLVGAMVHSAVTRQ